MKAIVTVVEKISSEAHIDIPEGLAELGIRQHVVDHYNSGEMLPLLNIFHVDFESMSVHIGKKLQITWQPGKPWSSKRPYYFCKLGRFTLTLLTDTEQNLTRTEVYFGHYKQLIYTSEKEISKELATVKLQNFLSGLAVELQILSHIEFSEDEV
ncbi:hypothetical protein CDG77_33245 [Nostoc sp. 'Peltigera membranacea cyanobiont' 213]|uniref:hypothetical protein n=1 Tax=Nostoc sp. 'Peltigera membranacea cyanobiont' 213 TaxID=2014530 RepID=UPI000B95A8E8|nr:hypothetical protein [Nostoc sp. 'Peltigera membranacea cyanobiont' 213]OYD86760.1 hypothetical protein CDG77_33245 [Nostoc sp. 'Peltigera membranacea cyanobiont' 213]